MFQYALIFPQAWYNSPQRVKTWKSHTEGIASIEYFQFLIQNNRGSSGLCHLLWKERSKRQHSISLPARLSESTTPVSLLRFALAPKASVMLMPRAAACSWPPAQLCAAQLLGPCSSSEVTAEKQVSQFSSKITFCLCFYASLTKEKKKKKWIPQVTVGQNSKIWQKNRRRQALDKVLAPGSEKQLWTYEAPKIKEQRRDR